MQKLKLQFKIKNYFFVVLVIFTLLLIAVPVFAAEIYFKTDSTTVRPGDPLEVLVLLNTEEEDINAVEGTVLFPDDILKLENINEANSILTFWPEKPRIYDGNKIKFAGITPGGYQEKTGFLFSITFQAKKEGTGIIEIKDSRVLLNDGQGTPTNVKAPNFQFSIFKEAPISKSQIKEDKDPPEEFKPEITQSPEIFGGKYFLVFTTQDKGSGIDHYEILEKEQKSSIRGLIKKDKWQVSESPYLLKDQKLKSHIFVKAVDKAGNERIATLSPQNPLKWYENYFVWLAILITIIIAYIIWRCLKRFGFTILFLVGITLAIISLAAPVFVFAASLYLSPTTGSYNVGQPFSVSVYVSSAGQSMNAASGVIFFPQDKLEVTSFSKNGSIFNLWVQEPSFSNSAGTITFEGIVLNPGFTGSAGKIITVNFKTKAVGTIPLTFSSGSVLANDGKGTNILASMSSGSYVVQSEIITPPVEEYVPPKNTPAAPVISSSTHPDSEKWYSNNDPEFSWPLPTDVNGISIYLSKSPTSNPGPVSDGLFGTKSYENVEDGIWYFHIKFKNKQGWGQITHRKVLIDTVPPEPFEIEVDNEGDLTNPSPVLHFASQDALSGIVYYEIKIGDGDAIPITVAALEHDPFKLSAQGPGKHRVITTAIDAADNSTSATTDFEIEPIEQPIITDLPEKVQAGDILIIKGTSKYPDATITVFIKKEGEEPIARDVKTDSQGNWTFVYEKSLDKGTYQVWLEITDSRGAKSYPTEKITIASVLPALIKFGKVAVDYLTIIITLIALIVFLIVVIAYSWYRISLWQKKLRKETREIEENVVKAFRALHEEVQEQIEYLDKKPGLSKGEKRIRDKLQEALKVSEVFISKEIKDVLKELE